MESHLEKYVQYLAAFKKAPEAIAHQKRYLRQVERELGHSVFECKFASQIDDAIMSAAPKRKTVYNGGHQDTEGEGMMNRLGEAVVCYFRWGFGERIVEVNIYPKNRFRRPNAKLPNFLTEEKVMAILNKEGVSERDKLAIRILIDTGMRISEVCRLQVKHIDFDRMLFDVHMTKVDRPKTPVFAEKCRDLLEDWIIKHRLTAEDYIFRNYKGNPTHPKIIRAAFRKIGKKLGFRMNPHSFRHAVGGIWMQNGATGPEVAQQLGLKDNRMLLLYTHLPTKHIQRVQKQVFANAKIYA